MQSSPCPPLSRREFLKSGAAVYALAGGAVASAAERTLSSVAQDGETLPHRTLGGTGVSVSTLALGGVIGMQLPPSADHDPVALAETALNLGVTYFDTLLTTLNPVSRRKPFRDDLLPVATRKAMGVIAMKVMGGGNGCLAAGNPLKQVLRPYHDETAHQVSPASLVRYTLSLPVSVAVIGVASVEQLKANVRMVREATPMALAERQALEVALG